SDTIRIGINIGTPAVVKRREGQLVTGPCWHVQLKTVNYLMQEMTMTIAIIVVCAWTFA
ncbi:hypothetical protein CHS0354_024517, partial [Potamilus streckersoni]